MNCVRAKFYFAAGAIYPSNAVCYIYNNLGQLVRIIERSGEGVTTNACDGYAALVGVPLGDFEPTGFAWLLAQARNLPAEAAGGMLGFVLAGLCVAAMPGWVRRRIVSSVRTAWQAAHCSEQVVRLRRGRLYLPGFFWRAVAVVAAVALLGSDPNFARYWTLYAQCPIPPNYSTETERITEFTYDHDGRLVQVNCPEGVINYQYDLATGRLVRTCTANSEIEYTYDELGRLKTVRVVRRNNQTVNETTTYTYTKVGSRESVALPNGVVTTWRYDELNRLTNVTHTASNNVLLASYTYGLHASGRRTNAVEVIKVPADEGGGYITNRFTWQYDGLYRLTNEVCISSVAGGSYTNVYEYDLVGNMLKKVRTDSAGVTVTVAEYDANDRLVREVIRVNGVPTQTNSYAYDANGSLIGRTNVTAGGTTVISYTYNLANKLSSVTGPGGTTHFVYNDSGIRVRSWTEGGTATLYLVDANNHTGYAQVLEEYAGVGGTPSLLRSYVIGDDVLAQASAFSLEPSYLLYDGHGSTRQLVSNNGGVAAYYTYEAYGLVQTATSSTSAESAPTSLLYCGEQYDAALKM